ncbi:MAG: SDR family NAD(P)-dependent oxidoreductase, partial [Desulfobacterales bacterium]
MKFKDKVVVVTGGASGIGRGMCIRFAGEGASVVVNYSKSKAKAINVVEEINFNGGDAIDIQADVSQDGEARQ